jgi:hypothetical protein
MYKCILCSAELTEPSTQHIKEDYAKIVENLKNVDPHQFFNIVFKSEWKE